MSVVPDLPWIIRNLIGRGLRAPDELPPPGGYSSWSLWYAAQGYVVGLDFLPLGDPAPEGCKLSMVWTRVGEDVAMIDMAFVKRDGSDTTPFLEADRDHLHTHAVALWDDLKGKYNEDIALDRLIFHDFGVDIASPNPQRRTDLLADVTGTTSNAQLPPQDAVSVTFKTDHRRSWGRVYLPAPDVAALFEHGNMASGFVDDVRTAFGTFADSCLADDIPLVVWAPRHGGKLLKYTSVRPKPDGYVLDVPDTSSVARSVNQVQVDDLFDVQRSRRNDKATHVATHTLSV